MAASKTTHPHRSLAPPPRRRVCPPLPLPPAARAMGFPASGRDGARRDLRGGFYRRGIPPRHRPCAGALAGRRRRRAALPALDPALLRDVYRTLLRVRVLGDEVRALSAAERIGGVPETRGHEAAAVGAAAALDARRRGRAGAAGMAVPPVPWFAGSGGGRAAARDRERPGAWPASSRLHHRAAGRSMCCPPLISRPPSCRTRPGWPGRCKMQKKTDRRARVSRRPRRAPRISTRPSTSPVSTACRSCSSA